MCGAGQGDIAGHAPRTFAFKVFQALFFGVHGNAFAAHFFQLDQGGQLRFGHAAVGEFDKAVGIGHGQHLRAQLDGFFGSILRHVAAAGNGNAFVRHAVAFGFEHVVGKINRAVARGFRTDEAAAVGQAFAGEDGCKFVGEFFVLAEQEADFAAAHADVARGNVGIRADVAVKLAHKGLAEAHHFGIRFTFGVEVGAAFAAAHGQGGQAVFKYLLESQEFQNAQVHGGVEAQAAFIRADGGIHLHAVASVHLHLALVVHPGNAEHNDAFGLYKAFQQALLHVFRILRQKGLQAAEDFFDGLVEFRLVGVALLNGLK